MQLHLDEKKQEMKSHGDFAFPVNISQEVLSRYERGSFSWHWHPEVELTLVVEGCISYQVNDIVYTLRAGDGIFCNSNALHMGKMIESRDCYYISTTFHPRFIYGYEGSILQTSYVSPFVNDASLGSIVFWGSGIKSLPWHKEILDKLRLVYGLYLEPSIGYELKVHNLLSSIWLLICTNCNTTAADAKKNTATRDTKRLRSILTFIHDNYNEKITLNDVAESINICKSECCRFFKSHMNETLFDYILYYRIEKSLPLLTEKGLSVTEIAESSGFTSPGYYARIFKKCMNCSPTEFRKRL